MKGYKRYRAGAWRLTVYAGTDAATGKKRSIHRTVDAPDNRTGAREADRALARLVAEVDAGHHEIRPDGLTFAQLLERWQQARRPDWSPRTAVVYEGAIRNHIAPGLGGRRLDKLRAIDLDRFYAAKRATMAASTVAKMSTIVSAALEQAVRWQLIATNPADHANPIKVRPTEITPPTVAEVAEVLAALRTDPLLDAFIRLATNTGHRRGALCALQWADITDGTVVFRRALVDGGPKLGIVVKDTKTGNVQPIALGASTIAALERHRNAQAVERLAAGDGRARWVFPATRQPDQPSRPDVMSQRWARIRACHGLDHVRFHDLRHFTVTTLLSQGVDVATVARRVGHATPNVTLSIYSHFIPARDQAAAAELDELLG